MLWDSAYHIEEMYLMFVIIIIISYNVSYKEITPNSY